MAFESSKRVLVLYSTRDGQTRKIADAIEQEMVASGLEVKLADLHESSAPSPNQFDGVLIAASIRYGKFNPTLLSYTSHYEEVLNALPSAFVSVNLTARKPEKKSPETNVYTRKFLESTPWKPTMCLVAAGALRYPRYRFFDKFMIRLIMKMTGGPTDPNTDEEYTDWQEVRDFSEQFSAQVLKASAVGVSGAIYAQ